MDLTGVITELRSELQSIDEAINSLGKLADLRRRRAAAVESDGAPEVVATTKRVGRPKKSQPVSDSDTEDD